MFACIAKNVRKTCNNKINFAYFSDPFYKEFAITSVNQRGRRVLMCPLGYQYSMHITSANGTWWRCNTTTRDEDGKAKRCQLRVRTKVINGYEMIEIIKQHSHQPFKN